MVELTREGLLSVYQNAESRKEIDLQSQNLRKISRQALRGLKSLEVLYLYFNHIDEIERDAFDDLANLLILRLQSNQLKSIEAHTFAGLANLKILCLSFNQIGDVQLGAFDSLVNLRQLELDNNKLTTIAANLFKGLGSLELLKLDHNEIASIDSEAFTGLKSLSHLDLEHNKLKKVASHTFKGLSSLKKLSLGNNELHEIESHGFSTLTSLRELHLWNNELKRIDAQTFADLKSLEVLCLNVNKIGEIETSSFSALSRLRVLKLWSNKLKHIDAATFRGLSHLERLDLDNNELETIEPRTFADLVNLELLGLDINRLRHIEASYFAGLRKLEYLLLRNNLISEIDRDAFADLGKLKLLWLQNNAISRLDRFVFRPLALVEIIRIHDNKFETITVSFFNDTESLKPEDLYVEENYESKLDHKGGYIADWNHFLEQFPASPDWTPIVQDELIGSVFNQKYAIKRFIGRGSFGKVFLVYDETDRVKKALKVIKKLEANDLWKKYNKIAENEINLLKKMRHDNIVEIIDNFDELGNLCFAMELCEDGNLKSKIRRAKYSYPIASAKILSWILGAVNGLRHVHSMNIIHRDIKPENLLLTKDHEIKLTGFGLAYYIDDSSVETNLNDCHAYWSPEQIRCAKTGEPYSFKADIWSLGCVLYELITLEMAFPHGLPASGEPEIPDVGKSRFRSSLKLMLDVNERSRVDAENLYKFLLHEQETWENKLA